MSYIGRMEIPPNHPFAHTQITFGAKQPTDLSKESARPEKTGRPKKPKKLMKPETTQILDPSSQN